jgi:hypothetical protein
MMVFWGFKLVPFEQCLSDSFGCQQPTAEMNIPESESFGTEMPGATIVSSLGVEYGDFWNVDQPGENPTFPKEDLQWCHSDGHKPYGVLLRLSRQLL